MMKTKTPFGDLKELISQELATRKLAVDFPFSKTQSRKEIHQQLNSLSQVLWNSIKENESLSGQFCVGVSFTNSKPFPIHFDFKSISELYDELIKSGVEIYCIISDKTPLDTENKFPLKENEIYFSFGTSLGLLSGIYNKQKKTESILRFVQPPITN
jgi:hypothetical protein